MRWGFAAAIAVLAALGATVAAAASVAEPPGYRLDDYRAAVPDTIRGARVIHATELHTLIDRSGTVLIDVLPAPRRPAGMQPGSPWMPLPRRDIPGSLWLPDVGRGAISPELDQWFRAELDQLTGGRKSTPVVFYCLASCWMSWNATKRAVSYGYTNAAWYPDGTDGWQQAGYPLVEAHPEQAPSEP